MNLLLNGVNLAFIFVWVGILWQNTRDYPLRRIYFPAVAFKFIATICLGMLYLFYYGSGDVLTFYRESAAILDQADESFLSYVNFLLGIDTAEKIHSAFEERPRALFFVKLVSILHFFTRGDFWILCLYFSLFCFTGSWYLANVLALHYPSSKLAASIAFLFYPSVVFWSAGILKESVVLGSLGFLAGAFLQWHKYGRLRIWIWVLTLVAAILILHLKYYYAAVLFPVLLSTIVTKIIRKRVSFIGANLLIEASAWVLILFVFLSAGTLLHPNLEVNNFLHVLVENHDKMVHMSDQGHYIQFNDMRPRFDKIIANFPHAVFAGIFYPMHFNSGQTLVWLSATENWILFLITLSAIPAIWKSRSSSSRILLIAVLFYSVVLAGFLALSTPNYGTLVRYKVGFLPFFTYLVLMGSPLMHIFKKISRIGRPRI